jgi:PAS domain S-box-containing protein
MKDANKTKDQLVSELMALRQKVSELEASDARRRRAGDMPGQGEEWYRRIIDAAYEGVWVIDAEGKTKYANQRMAEMLGCPTEEMLGRSAFDFIPEDYRAKLERGLSQHEQGIGEVSEFRLCRKDGSKVWVLSSTNPIQDEAGGTIGVLGVLTDITERKRSEEKIRFQAQLLDAAGQAVVATDMEGNITYWNRCAETLYGWSAEEVMGSSAGEILVPEDQKERASEIASELRAGRSWSGEFVVRRRDGTTFPVMATDTLVRDEQGHLVGTIGVCMDITERKWAEKRRIVQYGVSRLLAESTSLADSSRRILRIVGTGLEWDCAGLWAVDPDEEALRCIGTWRRSKISSRFETASRHVHLAKGEGLLGRAWGRGGPVWVADITRSTDSRRFTSEVRTAFAYPVRVGKKVVGVLALFSREARKPPDRNSTSMIASLSGQIGQFMERKRAEEELEKQMETLREQAQLLDLAHDAIIVRDMDGALTFWNRGAEETYGWSREEALGESSNSLLKTRFPKPLEEIEAELFRKGRWEGELVQTKRDGTQVVVASRWALKQEGHGQPSAILEIHIDITENKQLKLREHEARHQLHTALEALRESEARFERLTEANNIGVVTADFSGNITEVNEVFLQMVGYTHKDLLWGDLHWDEITPPEYLPLDEQAMEQCRRFGVCTPYEKEYIRKDGSRVPVLVGIVFPGESHNSAIVFVLDLTGQDGETPPEALGDGHRQVGYDLHLEEAREDLVAALQSMQDGQEKDLGSDGNLGQRLLGKELDDLRLADKRLRDLVSSLHVNHLDRGRPFIRAAQSLAQDRTFLQEVEFLVELNRQIRPEREIWLTVEDGFPSELPALTRLELLSILKEALVNARRHSEARCIRVTLGGEADIYWVEIADDGRGFEAEAHQEGTGITGMRESARALSGELEVECEPGRGTRVRVQAPS